MITMRGRFILIVNIKIDTSVKEPSVLIITPKLDDEVKKIYDMLEKKI